jgi:hypothetical protein
LAARPDIDFDGVHWWLARGADHDATTRLLQNAIDTLNRGAARNLKTGRRKQLYPLDLRGSGTPDHLLKVNDYKLGAGIRRVVRGSKALHELQMAEEVAARAIPTVVPLAAGERRAGGRLRSCYLLVPILDDVVDLRQLWLQGELPPRERRALVTAFGALTRQIHDAGIFQDDFAPNNFLVRRGLLPKLFMIDFERAQLRRANDEAARRFMLAKIDRELAGAPAGDRMRFLWAYCRGDRAATRQWWQRVEDFAPKLARRDFARLTRKTTRPGRRFRRLSHDAWRGYARVGTDDTVLVAALPEELASAGNPSIDTSEGLWRVQYAGIRRSEARRIWATANFLWARGGLCPRPLGAWHRGNQTVLLLEQGPDAKPLDQCPDPRRALAAARVLLDRLLALAEIREPLPPEGLVIERQRGSALRASLAAPHAVFLGRVAGQMRRERVSELICALQESSARL